MVNTQGDESLHVREYKLVTGPKVVTCPALRLRHNLQGERERQTQKEGVV
jgi:hypothetical protein